VADAVRHAPTSDDAMGRDVTDTAPASDRITPEPPEPRPRREILGPTGLVVMVVAILAFTAVSIIFEVAHNTDRATFKATVDVVGPVAGSRNEFRVVFHVRNQSKKAGHPDKCEASLTDPEGDRIGTAEVRLRQDIQPGQTLDEQAVGTAAGRPAAGAVRCRGLEPG
jgi:hypothetical protein